MSTNYDVVIIGSGLGGLECATMLSKEGMNVCVLEKAKIFGGCLQSFNRKGKIIDTGIHYVGSMGEGQIMRQYIKYFGILDQLSMMRLDNDFDNVTLEGKGGFAYHHGYTDYIEALAERFPMEKAGLQRYCSKLKEIGCGISTEVHKKGSLSAGHIDYLGVSAYEFINDCVSDNTLRNVLAGTNVLYAGVKESSNLYHHAMINHSNIEGSYRFTGGTQRIADALVEKIRDNGGTVINQSNVIAINVSEGMVSGVTLENREVITAKYFISNIHPATTFSMLEQAPSIKKAFRTRLNLLPNTYGLFSVYLLMKEGQYPYLNKNYYHYANGNDVWDSITDAQTLMPKSIFLSSQLSEPPSRFSEVITIMSPIDSTLFSQWEGTDKGKRGDDYNELKEKITNHIIDFAARQFPLLKESIEHVYSASPLTFSHYTGTPNGSAYGLLKDYKSAFASLFPTRTKLTNLFLTGQNVNVHGALGVTLTAAATCGELIGSEYIAKKVGNA